MICQHKSGVKFLAGIASWGLLCGHKDYPEVFSDMFKFSAWIERTRRTFTGEARSNQSSKTEWGSFCFKLFSFLMIHSSNYLLNAKYI